MFVAVAFTVVNRKMEDNSTQCHACLSAPAIERCLIMYSLLSVCLSVSLSVFFKKLIFTSLSRHSLHTNMEMINLVPIPNGAKFAIFIYGPFRQRCPLVNNTVGFCLICLICCRYPVNNKQRQCCRPLRLISTSLGAGLVLLVAVNE